MGSVRAIGSAGRLRFGLILVLSMVAVLGAAAPVAADEEPAPKTELQRVIDIAMSETGSKYAFASAGPNTFDCSGFVTYVYKEAGLLDRIGGKRRTVAGYLEWFKSQGSGRASRENPLPGDLIIWGKNKHMGIYLGDGLAISALINPYGVKVHKVTGYIGMKVKTYLHVHLER
jgi:cell wall-associated NlpC family hydrolase